MLGGFKPPKSDVWFSLEDLYETIHYWFLTLLFFSMFCGRQKHQIYAAATLKKKQKKNPVVLT